MSNVACRFLHVARRTSHRTAHGARHEACTPLKCPAELAILAPEAPPTRPARGDEGRHRITGPRGTRRTPTATRTGSRTMKFLVVDDSATMRRIVVNSLQRIGYTDIVEAEDGLDALNKYDASIGFVVTDWNMPNMTGTELVQSLRQRDDGRTVPVLMVTARSVREDIITALEAGVNNYIVKPFTPQVLKEKIDSLIVAPAA